MPRNTGSPPRISGSLTLAASLRDLRRARRMVGYPRLTAEMIRLASIYAAAYPLRGPRRKLPWHDQPPVRRGRRKLDAIAVS